MTTLKLEYATLVYQAGIANVFEVANSGHGLRARGLDDGQWTHRRLLPQADFRTCEAFAYGLIAAGVKVRVASCNRVGDIRLWNWTPGLADCPFRDEARTPMTTIEAAPDEVSRTIAPTFGS